MVHLAGHPWRTVAPVEVSRDGQELRLTQLHLAHADEVLELTGAFDGTRFQDVHLRAAQIDVTFLQRLVPFPDFVQGRSRLASAPVRHARRAGTGDGIDTTA